MIRFLRSRVALIMGLELIWLLASAALLVRLSHLLTDERFNWWWSLGEIGVVLAAYAFAFYLMDLYDLDLVATRRELVLNLTQSIGLVCVIIALFERCFDRFQLPLKLVLVHAGLTANFIVASRATISRLLRQRWESLRLGFVGRRATYTQLDAEKKVLGWLGFALIFLGEGPAPATSELGKRAPELHRVVVDEACFDQPGALEFLQECGRRGIKTERLGLFRERAFGKVQPGAHLLDELRLSSSQPRRTLNQAIRRGRDVLIAGIGLILASPLMLLLAIAIKWDSPGPVLFFQDRVGRHGRRFKMIKFRSMYQTTPAGEKLAWATLRRDPRITRIGSLMRGFHLDELPQLINVLKGDMSLVGPRPFHPLHSAQMETIPCFNLRLLVLPGITGWAQVRCDYSDSLNRADEVLARDLYYVKHAGLIFDLMIMAETLRTCIWRRGAR